MILKKFSIILVAASACFSILACGSSTQDANPPTPKGVVRGHINLPYGYAFATTIDGVPCIIFWSQSNGSPAMSCNWSKR